MNKDDGFTLVEVVVAIAVVAIVSTSIFQMFVTSSYANRKAKVMDMANIVAVRLAEEFKADPVNYDSGLRYYGGEGQSLEDDTTGAAIKVESQVQVPNASQSYNVGYYPDFVGTLDLVSDTDYDVDITNTCEIKVKAHGTEDVKPLANQDISHIKNNILPIKVNFPSGGTYPRIIYLTNNSDFEAELYVFNAKVSDSTIMPEQIVILDATQGASSITYVPVTSSSDTEYDLTLIVSSLNKNGSEELFRYSTKSYLHN